MRTHIITSIALLLIGLLIMSITPVPRSAVISAPGAVREYVILSPHFDDAALSLGGFLAQHGSQSTVVTFFTAPPKTSMKTSWDNEAGFTDSTIAANVRRKENEKALGIFSNAVINLDYLDNQYRKDAADAALLTTTFKYDIEYIITSAHGHHISVYGPSDFGKDITHPDHKILHDAFIAAEKENTVPNVDFYLYEDFPYVERYSIENQLPLKDFLESADSLHLALEAYSLRNIDAYEKIRAIREYASQVAAFSSIHKDIIKSAQSFTQNRCAPQSIFPCEVVYKIIP